jgi:hypothetical protein
LAERDIFLSRIQELERPGAIFSSARQASDSAFTFPAAIIREMDKPDIAVVDVGAENRDSEAHAYAPLMRAGSVKVIRFEAFNDEVVIRNEGDPSTVLKNYEVTDCDFLKIDVQGGELDVIKGGLRWLEGAILVQTKVAFASIHKGQPLFSDVDVMLRELSFDFVDLVSPVYNTYTALRRPLSRSRLLWADAIYFKSPERLEAQELLKAAYIAHINYGMYDLAADYLQHYDKRKGAKLAEAYNLVVR